MATLSKKEKYSVEEYLALLESSEMKYEYFNGQIYAMGGGTIKHGIIYQNVNTSINNALISANKSCFVFNSDVKVSIKEDNTYVFPDCFVVCNKIEQDDKDKESIINPILVVEVLSKGTQQYDKTGKFRKYRSIPGFLEYVLIEQNEQLVETYYCKGESDWEIRTFKEKNSVIEFKSLDIHISLDAIYRGSDQLEHL